MPLGKHSGKQIKTVLNHVSRHKAGVAGIYNRSSYAAAGESN
jgi:hypothetical protein